MDLAGVMYSEKGKYEMHFGGLNFRALHASERIRQGEMIMELPCNFQSEPDEYSLEVAPGVHIDCSQSLVGAINHSCEPNAVVRNHGIMAWRCIAAGEEITLDYKRTESKLVEPFECSCGHCPPGTIIK